MTRQAQVRGIPALRAWSRAELLLAGILLALSALAWLLTRNLAMPDMRMGILTGMPPAADDMGGMGVGPAVVVLFLVTWIVMMAAMMFPGITPFTVGVSRLVRARHARRGTLAALTVGYLAVWSAAGILAYFAWQGLQTFASVGDVTAVRAGAVVLLVAGVYQFTPLKQWCLARCRSPLALVLRYGDIATRSRRGALVVGFAHGGYCLGCCWALMAVLLALGVMSLPWMAAVAAVIAVEKILPRGEMLSYVLGALLAAAGAVLLAAPGLLVPMA